MSQQPRSGQVQLLDSDPERYYLTMPGRFTLASAYCFLVCLFTFAEGVLVILLVAFARAAWGLH